MVFVMVSPAPCVLILGVLGQMVTGWPLWVCVVLGAVLSTFYVANGGLRTDIRVNVFQFALMFLGFGLIVPMAVMRYGGFRSSPRICPPGTFSRRGQQLAVHSGLVPHRNVDAR